MKQNKHAGPQLVALANDLPTDQGSGPCNAPGVICLANSSRFVETNFNEPLTTYAVGMPINDVQADLDALCPRVPVPRRFTYRSYDNIYELMTETVDDIRTIGADFKRVEYRGAEVESKTLNKGLAVVIDLDEIAEGEPWEQTTVAKLKRRLLLNELRRAAVLFSAATAADETWNGTAGSDADSDVATDIIASVAAGGVKANRVFYGGTAWSKRFLDCRKQSTAGGFASSALTPQQLASLLGVDMVHVSTAAYQSTTSAKAEIFGSEVYVYHQQASPDVMDPSNVKRFVTPVGGGDFRVYTQQISAKQYVIAVEHYSHIVTVKSTGFYAKTIT